MNQLTAPTIAIRKMPSISFPQSKPPRGDVHAESRPVVFDEAQLEPVREDDDRLVEVHVGLDPDFERLVCEEQQKDKERYSFRIHFVRYFPQK